MADRRVTGWWLDRHERADLLARFPPAYPHVIADHVTLESGPDAALPAPKPAEIVGRVDDGAGVEAMVVRIDATTDRPDGSTYHVTWSLNRAAGRRARESNDVIRERGWTDLETAIPITLTPGELS